MPAKICPDCTDGRVRGKPCPTCNPGGGLLDGVVSLGRRARNAATGRTKTVSLDDSGRAVTTTRTGFLGTETVKAKKPPAKRKAAKRKKR